MVMATFRQLMIGELDIMVGQVSGKEHFWLFLSASTALFFDLNDSDPALIHQLLHVSSNPPVAQVEFFIINDTVCCTVAQDQLPQQTLFIMHFWVSFLELEVIAVDLDIWIASRGQEHFDELRLIKVAEYLTALRRVSLKPCLVSRLLKCFFQVLLELKENACIRSFSCSVTLGIALPSNGSLLR